MIYDLVFEGGGAKGFVLVGACDELFKRNHSFGRLLGTSAGAITATLLAAGYTPDEMLDALAEQENGASVFASFMAPPPPLTEAELADSAVKKLLESIRLNFLPEILEKKVDAQLLRGITGSDRLRNILAFVERGGWYAADPFLQWLTRKLDSGTGKNGARRFSAMTLSQMFKATGVELSLVASDTTDFRMLVLNHRTAPDCPIVWAVRMSMSIPLVWNEIAWRAEWGKYLDRDIAGHLIVDGGLLSNFPIELFISDEARVTSLMGPKGSNPILGFLIDERLPVATTRGRFITVDIKPRELRTVQRLERLVDTATTAHDKMVLEENSHLVVFLPAKGYGTTEFDMTEPRRKALVAAGRAAVQRYFDDQEEAGAEPAAAARGEKPPAGRVTRGGTRTRGAGRGPSSRNDRIALRMLE